MPERSRNTALRLAVAVPVLSALGLFLYSDVRKNWATISAFRLRISASELFGAFALSTASFLLEARAWQRTLNGHLRRHELGFFESVAVLNTSGLFKYLPGRVWTYGAQMLWLGRRGVSKASVLYVNLVCFMYSALTAASLGAGYFIIYVYRGPQALALWGSLATAYVGAVIVGPLLLSTVLRRLNRFFGPELSVEPAPSILMLEVALYFALSWATMGVAGYYCGRGVGLAIAPGEVFAITASMSLALIVGYVSALTPGGIGVREGLMLLILKNVSTPQVSIVLPVTTRLLYTVIELLLGAFGGIVGLRRGLFTDKAREARSD